MQQRKYIPLDCAVVHGIEKYVQHYEITLRNFLLKMLLSARLVSSNVISHKAAKQLYCCTLYIDFFLLLILCTWCGGIFLEIREKSWLGFLCCRGICAVDDDIVLKTCY